MQCIKRGCRNTALPNSNYCREHKPRRTQDKRVIRRKAAKKAVVKFR